MEIKSSGSRAEIIAEAVADVLSAQHFMVVTMDKEGETSMTLAGLRPDQLVDFLQTLATYVTVHLSREGAQDALFSGVPAERKSHCPSCNEQVLVTRAIPEESFDPASKRSALCVCTCGAFLVPFNGGSGELLMRLMQEAEIADFASHVDADQRMEILRMNTMLKGMKR